jgi:aryl-alcohol dehydrogenase-like predicted oxidoreductase
VPSRNLTVRPAPVEATSVAASTADALGKITNELSATQSPPNSRRFNDELEAVMRKETLDFVQLNYSIDDRAAERTLLPLAADRGAAVLVNLPFGGGGLLRRLSNRPLPDWAGEIGCTSWAQILLKFVLAEPAVTCVIPGTGNPTHMADNCQAGTGMLPDAALRKRIIAHWEAGK